MSDVPPLELPPDDLQPNEEPVIAGAPAPESDLDEVQAALEEGGPPNQA